MDRYYKSSASAAPPSAPDESSGDFPTSGNPQTATPATKPGAYWFYMVTESLRNVIVAAGLAPNRLSLTLLKDAILLMISAAIQSALTPTGGVMKFMRSSSPSGWVRVGGGTIGDASSGASERAHADCHDLYVMLWNEFSQSLIVVVGGRGASAEDDWLAHKRLTLFDDQGVHGRAWDYSGAINPVQGLGVYQADQMPGHTHGYSKWEDGTGDSPELVGLYDGNGGPRSRSIKQTASAGAGSEVRVKTRAYLQCVKL